MNRTIFWNIFMITILLTLGIMILQSGIILTSSSGSNYEQIGHKEWAKIEAMPYKEATKYLQTHSPHMNGADVLKNYFSSFYMFSQFISSFLPMLILIFITVLITALRISRICQKSASHAGKDE